MTLAGGKKKKRKAKTRSTTNDVNDERKRKMRGATQHKKKVVGRIPGCTEKGKKKSDDSDESFFGRWTQFGALLIGGLILLSLRIADSLE